ncbi:undecaprenyl-diphosphate phosphatase [Prolixibacter denitrificans]|jgi:undecaprenyl-diphosphatase|uniref:Undecaprenyl-diphosphatase n=1 Tax=Prolixibacter denitrificans TaxID=1541063 RepID=A0A2P8CEF8_9BACT|nr:undecaprenyl-diphosphate phosphatase [Prolixibacter denitrificans]PSK83360.1 undecaprenyl-diphosphatase [Prolixibacter denitrificans]GET21759.1 undecaprenyl-diphosphatase 1 [Prolixibacter denitrificans]
MTDIIKSIILGIIEGITEFLPISSTGHLIIANQFVTFEESFTNMFDVVIQLGAILSVIYYFRKEIIPKSLNIAENKRIFDIWFRAVAGVVPALILGAAFGSYLEEKLFNPVVVSTMLIIGGLVLIFIDRKDRPSRFHDVASMDYKTVLLIGLIQCMAMIPGTSRSAATIIGAMLLGADRKTAAEFSFFLAIPTMIAASGYSLLKHHASLNSHDLLVLGVGFVVSFIVALLVIAFLMNFIRKHTFQSFGYYRIVLGVVILAWIFLW